MKLSDKTILVIDDDESFQRIITKILENVGIRVVSMFNISDALIYLSTSIPDLIILDINLPVYNGYTFLTARKKINRINTVPVLIVSGNVDKDKMNSEVSFRAIQYLEKPIEAKLILQKIKQMFSSINDFSYKVPLDRQDISVKLEAKLTQASDEMIAVESPVKLKEDTFFKIKILDLNLDLASECYKRVYFNESGKEFKYYLRIHGLSDQDKKTYNKWRLKNIWK